MVRQGPLPKTVSGLAAFGFDWLLLLHTTGFPVLHLYTCNVSVGHVLVCTSQYVISMVRYLAQVEVTPAILQLTIPFSGVKEIAVKIVFCSYSRGYSLGVICM